MGFGWEGFSAGLLLAHCTGRRGAVGENLRCLPVPRQEHPQPAQALQTILLSWPFTVWGLDIVGEFPRAVGGYRYLIVLIDKFTK